METDPAIDPSPLTSHLIVTTTLPTEVHAQAIAEAVVRDRLAACAQVQGPIQSTFRWQGAVDHSTEWYCHCKTTRAAFPALERLIRSLHPYEVPEIIATPVVAGHEPYLAWVVEQVRSKE